MNHDAGIPSRNGPGEIFAAWADLVFPRLCTLCEEPLGPQPGGSICRACWRQAEELEPPFCPTCGQPLRDPPVRYERCTACPPGTVWFDGARSALAFRGPVVDASYDFKYHFHRENRELLGRYLVPLFGRYLGAKGIDLLAPVPLHPARERDREFNQSALLAGVVAEAHGVDCESRLLVRCRNTTSQTRLAGARRLLNLRGVMAVRDPERVRERRVVLIDDVYTSGATVNDCARALKENGAAEVYVLTVARVVRG